MRIHAACAAMRDMLAAIPSQILGRAYSGQSNMYEPVRQGTNSRARFKATALLSVFHYVSRIRTR